MRSRYLIASLVALWLLTPVVPACAADSPEKVFARRILPIFKSPNPSSCVQCHLAGVDLKDYILPSAEKTFRSLRDQDLIDLAKPERSRILALIAMGKDDTRSPTVRAANRKAEYEAFAAWIKSCANDPALRNSPKLDAAEWARPTKPNAVIRHERADRLLESFERTIWAMRFRCMNCHTEGTPQNDKNRKQYGDRVAWIKKAGAQATMDYLIGSKLINPKEPDRSLLLQKPMGLVKHGGGTKFAVGDQGYKAFRQWIEDVAAIKAGRYIKAGDLPRDEKTPLRFGADAWLKLNNTPPAWADKLLQVDVFAWDSKSGAWEGKPVASSDRVVWGKGKLWQHTLTLLAEPRSARAKTFAARPALPPGKYLIKVYVDGRGRLAKNWMATLSAADYVGQVEVNSEWKEGYSRMTVADAARVRR